ncbi:MAG: hypothetical protein EPN21_20065, partial [Methylococcaceae bacterium]
PARHCVDVAAFTAEPPAGRHPADLQRMADAIARYRGEFMAGFSLPDCPDFEAWLLVKREALQLHALSLLEQLAQAHEQQGAYASALPFARRYTELDAWNEAGQRRLMRLYALNRQPGAALAQYEACCRILDQELGLLPEKETQALADSIRCEEWPATGAGQGAITPDQPLPGEKRQVTVLYCRLAPAAPTEDLDASLELLRLPQENCREIIRRYCGYRVPDPASGILAYFGYPQAFEHAARWAVQAALALAGAAGPQLDVRVGVHSGTILTGGESSMPDAVGRTSRQAAELARLAGNGEVVISSDTHRLVAAYFESAAVDALGASSVPAAYKVRRETGVRHRPRFGLTPLVGREQPLAALLALWQRAGQGELCKLLIRGEPGIGKSRLLHALCHAIRQPAEADGVASAVRTFEGGERYAQRTLRFSPRAELNPTALPDTSPYRILPLHCFQEYQHIPFYPLLGLLETLLAFAPQDTDAVRFAKLEAYCRAHLPGTAAQCVPLLAAWLSLPPALGYRPSALAPAKQKEAIFAALFDLLRELATAQPLLLIIEDLHWLDHSTLEWLQRLIAWRPAAAILALFSARPQFQPSWLGDAVPVWELPPLAPAEVVTMAHAMAEQLPAAMLDWIVARADGVPLFVEEMVQLAPTHVAQSIPDTLQDLLAARLDATGGAKRIAQQAATIGREFSYALLQRLSALTPSALQAALQVLQQARLIEAGNGESFLFKHALLCDAAYQSQPKAQRQVTHRRIAAELERHFSALAETRPELLAQHWGLGGATLPALEYWLKAGQRAERHSANREALDHYAAALRLIDTLPAGAERNQREFIVQVRRGIVLLAVEGLGSPNAALAFHSALSLCRDLEQGVEAFRVLWGLWVATLDRSFAEAELLAQQLLRLTEAGVEPYLHVQAHYVAGNNAFWLGKLADSRRHLEAALALYQPVYHEALIAQFGENSAVTSGIILSWTLWLQGFPDQARLRCSETVEMARSLDHPYSYCFALSCAAILRRWLGETAQVAALAQETLQLAQQYEFSLWQAVAVMALGWSTAMQGERAGLEQLDAAIHAMRSAMDSAAVIFLAPQIEAHLRFGQHATALAAVEQALAEADAKSDCHFVAELYRLKGEGLLGLGQVDEAEACFQQALTISRRQAAKSLELRAAMSLAELWSGQGRQAEADAVLAPVYGGFDEGFDTRDLRNAQRWLRRKYGAAWTD